MPTRERSTRRGLRWSVRTRILAAILTVTALGMAAAGTTAYLAQRDRILQDVDESLRHSLDAVRAVVLGADAASEPDTTDEPDASEPDPTDEPDATSPHDPTNGSDTSGVEAPATPGFSDPEAVLEAVLARVLPDGNESSLGLINGSPRFISVADVPFRLDDDREFIDRVVAEVADGTIRMGTYAGESGHLRYLAVPISVEGIDDTAIFVTAIELNAELGEITTAFQTYAWVAVVSLVAVGLVGWFVAGRLLKPIRSLRETASRITASDLKERIPITGNDDVSALTATVNDMLDRIDESIRAQGQLLDDVRHELKTPVTIVRGHLELLDPDRPGDVRETRDLVIDELDRMVTLVDDISLLAASEKIQLKLEDVDVTELSEQIYLKSSAIPGHEWRLETGEAHSGRPVRLDPDRITQAVLQLVDNAAKYSPPGSPIVIGSTQLPTAVHLWVADEGPGIPPEAQQRIFERFGRVDSGRGIAGSGLGLSIVDVIARSHGGQVLLSSSPNGSRFTIEIPTQQPEEAP